MFTYLRKEATNRWAHNFTIFRQLVNPIPVNRVASMKKCKKVVVLLYTILFKKMFMHSMATVAILCMHHMMMDNGSLGLDSYSELIFF